MIAPVNGDEDAEAPAIRTRHKHAEGESPAEALARMAGGFAMTQVLYTSVQAGIADFLGDRECNAAEIAAALHLDAPSLERFLRMMVVLDLAVQVDLDRFRLSAAGHLLRGNHPQSMRERVNYIGAVNYSVASAAIHTLRTGKTAFEHVFGMPFFDYLAQRPELGDAFNGLMQRGVEARVARILDSYDFSKARHIVDLGGGNGALLSVILAKSNESTGVVFDLPAVVAQARDNLRSHTTGSRVDFVEGDLFNGPYPAGADLYILSNIIHDWTDARAETILRHCRQAMLPNSELIIVEEIRPPYVLDSPSTAANDYSMLLLTGGLERSEAQFRTLIEHCGLKLSKITPFQLHTNDSRRKGNWALLHCHAN